MVTDKLKANRAQVKSTRLQALEKEAAKLGMSLVKIEG